MAFFRFTSSSLTKCVSGLAAILFSATAASAQVANYPFTTGLSSTDTDPSSVAGDIVLGAGLTDATEFTTAISGNGNPAPALRVNGDETATTLAASRTAGDDFTFTLTPASGGTLQLQTLTFDLFVNNAAVTADIGVFASINGGTFMALATYASFSSTSIVNESIDLTSLNIGAGQNVQFAFLVADNQTLATRYTGFDNVVVTSAVPEPGTWAALLLGAPAILMVARKRRAAAKLSA